MASLRGESTMSDTQHHWRPTDPRHFDEWPYTRNWVDVSPVVDRLHQQYDALPALVVVSAVPPQGLGPAKPELEIPDLLLILGAMLVFLVAGFAISQLSSLLWRRRGRRRRRR